MEKSFEKMVAGYHEFRQKYAKGDSSVMKLLSDFGQKPKTMVIACCDSRVDPALILQCDPGDLFVVRNVANIVPPYEKDDMHHGTSAALEFAVRFLGVNHLVLLGHSQCGGIQALLSEKPKNHDDFISNWVSLIKDEACLDCQVDEYAKIGLEKSYLNCLTFPWIKEKVDRNELKIHLWFFDIKAGKIYCDKEKNYNYTPL
ncbi:MAG: carbonic anhydrase [Chlamydiae bacterium]|jgi:carbonic anhydrase|nr:carbonic anhydrase [Chlamydiota bacterium]